MEWTPIWRLVLFVSSVVKIIFKMPDVSSSILIIVEFNTPPPSHNIASEEAGEARGHS